MNVVNPRFPLKVNSTILKIASWVQKPNASTFMLWIAIRIREPSTPGSSEAYSQVLISFLDYMTHSAVLQRNIWKPDSPSAGAINLCVELWDHSTDDNLSTPDNPPNLAYRVARSLSQCSVQIWLECLYLFLIEVCLSCFCVGWIMPQSKLSTCIIIR